MNGMIQPGWQFGADAMFDIEEELKKLPPKPGVYIMHDNRDAIIYVGKAINLSKRVRSYFRKTNKTSKIERMVERICSFEYIVTDSELEALVLECNLIKENRPKYNTMLKDDKTYPFIKVTLGEEYPRVFLSRTLKKDKSKYFGPYTSAGAIKDNIDLINKLFQLRTCNRNLPKEIKKDRACLNYYIKQCTGPCQGYVSKDEYAKQIAKALDFLNGNYSSVAKDLENRMKDASERMEFEEAMEYRDLLESVKVIAQKQKITQSDGEDKDIIALASDEEDCVIQVFFVRNGKLIGREHFHMTEVLENTNAQMLESFIKQFYSGTPFIPKELLVQEEMTDADIIAEWLSQKRGNKVSIRVPKIGMKEKLVELAYKNAEMVLSQDKDKIKQEESRTIGAVKEIADLLGLENIYRIEAFDISNISGYETVGSMVAFEKGKAKRSDYRKFKIKTVVGSDDYKSMEEVLNRRFHHGIEEKKALEKESVEEFGSFTKFPDLIMMDGGKGQVNVALRVLDKYKLDIPVCGMVKDDHHRTRGLYYNNQEFSMERSAESFRLITRIQDEAHRFAIEYHRLLRSKGQVHSLLDDIGGIGNVRRKALLRQFGSLEKIKEATLEELKAVPEMNEKSANAVLDFFKTR